MRSGSLYVTIPSLFEADIDTPALVLSTGQLSLQSASPLTPTTSEFDDLSWTEDATPVVTLPEYVHIDIQPASAVNPRPATLCRPKLLHGRSLLGLAKPVFPEDIQGQAEPRAARPARILRLICDERRTGALIRLERRMVFAADPDAWHALKDDVPIAPATPKPIPLARAHNTEQPLARSVMKDIHLRRVLDLSRSTSISALLHYL